MIAGATGAEVLVDSVHAASNTISGNQIGSSRSGKVALPSTSARGILVAGANATAIANNAVTGQKYGISIQGRPASLPAGPAGGTVPGTSGGTGITHASVSGNVVGPLPGGTRVPTDAQQCGHTRFRWNRRRDRPEQSGVVEPGRGGPFPGSRCRSERQPDRHQPGRHGRASGRARDAGSAKARALTSGWWAILTRSLATRENLVSKTATSWTVRAELIGTTKLGNAALRPFSGKLPWGDLIGQDASPWPGRR